MTYRLHKTFRFVCLLFVMGVALSGCEQMDTLMTPGTPSSVKLGLILDRSAFISTQYGAQLALAEVNLASGFFGIPIELVIRDSGGDPSRAEALAEELITQEKVVAILGPNTSEEAVRVGLSPKNIGCQ